LARFGVLKFGKPCGSNTHRWMRRVPRSDKRVNIVPVGLGAPQDTDFCDYCKLPRGIVEAS
jgi:hypothetical protein